MNPAPSFFAQEASPPPSPFGDDYVGPLGAWAGDDAVSQAELDAATLGTKPGTSILSTVLQGEREAWKKKHTATPAPAPAPAPPPLPAVTFSPFDLAHQTQISEAVLAAHLANVQQAEESRRLESIPRELVVELSFNPHSGALELALQDRSLVGFLRSLGPTIRGTFRF